MTFSFQEDANPPIAVARILQRQALHGGKHRCTALGANRAIGEGGAGGANQLASLALRMPSHHREGNLLAPGRRAHHFRRLISLSVSIAISRSASMRLSLV